MSKKEIDQFRRRLRRQGFAVRLGGSGHWRVTSPSGETITMPRTPGGGRSVRNVRASLRKIGAKL